MIQILDETAGAAGAGDVQEVDIVRQVALSQLLPSKTQPRTVFDPMEMQDLIESVRTHGIIQPLLVRPSREVLGSFELIAGERRQRAAKEVGLATAPVIVRDMSDREVLEVQLIENLQRDDLTELEEAAGYRRLLDLRDAGQQPIYSVEKISAAVGKPRQRIYFRLKLLRIPRQLRLALEKKEVLAEVAEMVGAIPSAELRERAAEEILKPTFGTEPMNRAAAREHIRNHYMRDLSGAPFDQKDPELVIIHIDDATGERVTGGACTDCPMRSGNMPGGNPKRPDVCTNPRCYEMKCDAHWTRLHESAAAEGKRLLTSAEAAAVFDEQDRVRLDSDYVDIAQQPDRGIVRDDVTKIPSWKKLLAELPEGSARPEMVIARDGRGRIRELVIQSSAMEAVNLAAQQAKEKSIFDRSRASGSNTGGGGGGGAATSAADNAAKAEKQRKEREEQKVAFEVRLASMTALVDAIAARGMITGFWEALVETALVHAGHDGQWFACKRLKLDPASSKIAGTNAPDYASPLRDYAAALIDDDDALAFVVELLLGKAFKSLGTNVRAFQGFAELYEIDLDAVEKAVRAGEPVLNGEKTSGQSDIKAAPDGKIEHHWPRTPIGGTADLERRFKCSRCGVQGVQLGTAWPPVVEDRELVGAPCAPTADQQPETCSRNDCKRPARPGRKMCEQCADIVRKAQQKKRSAKKPPSA